MGLFGSSSDGASADPEIRQFEKIIANEAKADQRNMDHAIKDFTTSEKSHNKSIKEADKAEHTIEKSIKKEHSTAQALNKAEHKHDAALADQKNARKSLEIKRKHEAQLDADVQQRRGTLEQLQQRKEANDQSREAKLAQIHQQAADRRASLDNGGSPTGTGGTTRSM
ncbi:hypothetical protein B0H21DRAFT_527285 [Amylocystis lapponica]|nr:hypothetical protein B0H21DRAFT_527285 [Amylocystis lapponica]